MQDVKQMLVRILYIINYIIYNIYSHNVKISNNSNSWTRCLYTKNIRWWGLFVVETVKMMEILINDTETTLATMLMTALVLTIQITRISFWTNQKCKVLYGATTHNTVVNNHDIVIEDELV